MLKAGNPQQFDIANRSATMLVSSRVSGNIMTAQVNTRQDMLPYLAMDSEDSMPLIVDQPEENLDSESIYSLLSHYFRSAKLLRQVIVITHNPNLVVNTDSDQVIVASADRLSGAFPTFSYESGGLKDGGIRMKCTLM